MRKMKNYSYDIHFSNWIHGGVIYSEESAWGENIFGGYI